MTVTEENLKDYKEINLRFKKNRYPIPLDKNLPKMYFVSLFVGSRGSGKTFSCCQLLKQYEKSGIYDTTLKCTIDQRIVLFSPTHSANPVFNSLKNLDESDIIHSYSDAHLTSVIENIQQEREDTLEYQKQLKVWQKFLKIKSVQELDQEDLFLLERLNYDPPKEPKYPNGCCVFLILDDLIGSSAFKSVGKSALTNLCLKNRHLQINILIMTQNLKAIPKSIRTNTSLFVIFRFASKKIIINDLYEEVSNSLTLEDFEELYDFATKDDHDSLVIDFTQPKPDRFKMNFSKILHIS